MRVEGYFPSFADTMVSKYAMTKQEADEFAWYVKSYGELVVESTAARYELRVLKRSVFQIIVAWTDKGRVPRYHNEAMKSLRRDWPSLATAIDSLASQYGHVR